MASWSSAGDQLLNPAALSSISVLVGSIDTSTPASR
jgi:hypothetical protein